MEETSSEQATDRLAEALEEIIRRTEEMEKRIDEILRRGKRLGKREARLL